MLIEFSVENFKSIKSKQTFSMSASSDKKLSGNVAKIKFAKKGDGDNEKMVLKTSVIYGPNASGKSNVIEAMAKIRSIIKNSHLHQQGDSFPVKKFRLDEGCLEKPTIFEFFFIHNNIKYNYYVEILQKEVLKEQLSYWPNGRQVDVFTRDKNDIVFSSSAEPLDATEKLRLKIYAEELSSNILFLSLANKVSIQAVKDAFFWFSDKLAIIYANNGVGSYTTPMINESEITSDEVLSFLKIADDQIQHINISEKEAKDVDKMDILQGIIFKNMSLKMKNPSESLDLASTDDPSEQFIIIEEKTVRNGISKTGEVTKVPFDLSEESDGTKQYYNLLGPIIKTLKEGGVLVCDELDSSLHSLLVQTIVELFINEKNKKDAQLIFTAHDACLLYNKALFRHDQVWLTEKLEDGSTDLFSVNDFKLQKEKSPDILKHYLKGAFGAIPVLNLEFLDD